MKKIRREGIEWLMFLTVIGVLYFTGLHTEVFGTLQRGLLATGILQPDIETESETEASYNIILIDVNGKELDLEDWKGETIFINLWATWCPPCIAEMPDINELYNEVGQDVKFAMISVDKEASKAFDFAKRKDFDFPVYFLKSGLPQVYATNSIPTTYLISPEGKIVVTNKGMAQYNNEKFINYLKTL